jgi:hypothetical protein
MERAGLAAIRAGFPAGCHSQAGMMDSGTVKENLSGRER